MAPSSAAAARTRWTRRDRCRARCCAMAGHEAEAMSGKVVGTIAELWRYPIKSMLGERLQSVAATAGGLIGDRAWALRGLRTGNIVSAKKWARVFEFSAVYEVA